MNNYATAEGRALAMVRIAYDVYLHYGLPRTSDPSRVAARTAAQILSGRWPHDVNTGAHPCHCNWCNAARRGAA